MKKKRSLKWYINLSESDRKVVQEFMQMVLAYHKMERIRSQQ